MTPSSTSTPWRAVWAVLAAWLVVKVVSAWWWVLRPDEVSDTAYYFSAAQSATAGAGIENTLREYPTPAALLLTAPVALGVDDVSTYRNVVLIGMAVADLAFTLLVIRRAGVGAGLAWIAVTAAMGSMPLLRFDILPAVVAGAAVLAIAQDRLRVGAVLVAVGTGLKVWPVVLAPLIAAGRRRWSAFAVFAATGAALVIATLPLGGLDRLFSPLGYQGERGLQIEAIAAVVPMIAWATDPGYRVWYAPSRSYEVEGPGVETWLTVSSLASVVGGLGCLTLLALWLLRGTPRAAVPWLALTLVGTFVVTSKALSPQYMLWLGALTVVVLAPPVREHSPRPAVTVAALLALCVLTTVIYPVVYPSLIARNDDTPAAVIVLAVRNVALLAFVVWCAVTTVRLTRRCGTRPAGRDPLSLRNAPGG